MLSGAGDDGGDDTVRGAVDRMVQQALEEAQQKYKTSMDVKRKPAPVFAVGQRVMVRSAVLQSKAESKAESELTGQARKLLSKYVGPLRVMEKVNANAIRVALPRNSTEEEAKKNPYFLNCIQAISGAARSGVLVTLARYSRGC
jgi:hypothetical protein